MGMFKIDNKLIKVVNSMYSQTQNYVRYIKSQSDEFITKDGLRQGGVLSPLLFIIVMDEVHKERIPRVNKLFIGHCNLERVNLRTVFLQTM